MDFDFEQKIMSGKRVLFLQILCFVVNSITLLLIIYKLNIHRGTIALKYNVVTGVNWYGKGYNLYTVPAIALVITVINSILYQKLKNQQRFLAVLGLWVTMAVQIILLAFVLFLIPVN